MFFCYSLKSKAYKCFNQRTKSIVEIENGRVDEKCGIQERILYYNFDEQTNTKANLDKVELFYETSMDF